MKKPDANTLERSYTMKNGKTFSSTLAFSADGCTNTLKNGDVVAKRIYKRS